MTINTRTAGPNTRFSYMYRDGSNYKTCADVVFSGTISEDVAQALHDSLEEKTQFIPGLVGLRDLQNDFNGGQAEWSDDWDHPQHVFLDISTTGQSPTDPRSIDEFVRAMRDATWDDNYRPPEYDAMVARAAARAAAEAASETR